MGVRYIKKYQLGKLMVDWREPWEYLFVKYPEPPVCKKRKRNAEPTSSNKRKRIEPTGLNKRKRVPESTGPNKKIKSRPEKEKKYKLYTTAYSYNVSVDHTTFYT